MTDKGLISEICNSIPKKNSQPNFKMRRRSEQAFFQRHTDGQQAHGKMLNMANHQRNANQNHNEISGTSHLSEWLSSKRSHVTNVGKDVEKREPLYVVGGNVNWCSHYEKQYGGFSKNKYRTII